MRARSPASWPAFAWAQDGANQRRCPPPPWSWCHQQGLALQDLSQGANVGLTQDLQMVSRHLMLDDLIRPSSPPQVGADLHPRRHHLVLVGAHDEQAAMQALPL